MDGEELNDKRYIWGDDCLSPQFRSVYRIASKVHVCNYSKPQAAFESTFVEAHQASKMSWKVRSLKSVIMTCSFLEEIITHQPNVNRSGSNTQASQTLRATSPELPSTSTCSQTALVLPNVLSDSARAFSGASESTSSYGGAVRMLRDLTSRIVQVRSSWDPGADLQETSRAAQTAAQLCGRLREQPRP